MKRVLPDHVIKTNERFDVTFERGQGAYLFGSDGRRYLDFYAGIAVSSLGHAHPHLVKTLRAYADRVWHVSNNYRCPEQERLAARLVEHSFADRCFFCNSGLEAAEAAIKFARLYQFSEGQPERVEVVTIEGAFHGRSLATLAATNNPTYLEGFGPRVSGFTQVRFGDMEALGAEVDARSAAVMVEPVQGEGGVRPLASEYLRQIRQLCNERGVLLIFDEVQTGIGRTGRLFAHEWSGVVPDLMMLAKGLGGGLPIGAVLATEQVASAVQPGKHGSTFGGNPLATAMGNAVLDVVMEPGFLKEVERIGQLLWTRLDRLQQCHRDLLIDVRGCGLLLGMKCVRPARDYVDAILDGGMLTHTADGNVLRLLPPLVIREREVDEGMECLEAGLQALANGSAARAAVRQ